MASMGSVVIMLVILALSSVQDAQPPGNVPRPRPPRERVVYNPESVPASQVNFLKPSDMVIGVAQRGAAKAYWLPMLIWTHFIQDRLGDSTILVTW